MLLKKCKACLETIETDKFTFRINSYGKRYPLSVCKACKARAARINRNDLETEISQLIIRFKNEHCSMKKKCEIYDIRRKTVHDAD